MPQAREHEQHAQRCARGRLERLAALLDRDLGRIAASGVGIVLSHPDDETIGCGAQLARWEGATLVLVTDGAPLNLKDARALGFSTAEDYAKARRRELEDALAVAGMAREALVAFDISDQQVARSLVVVTGRLIETIETRNLGLLFTHAFEGGHPDHDATAFCVHAAARLLAAKGRSVLVIEMPFYKTGEGDMARQHFSPTAGVQEITIHLTAGEQELKRRMMAAHRTQAAILNSFDVGAEYFRIAPSYDFSQLPNEGRLLYEQQDWGLTGPQWLELARQALLDLGLEGKPC